jgi:hypothetical protein
MGMLFVAGHNVRNDRIQKTKLIAPDPVTEPVGSLRDSKNF